VHRRRFARCRGRRVAGSFSCAARVGAALKVGCVARAARISFSARRRAARVSGPKLRLGTKWPSMMSRCSQRRPVAATWARLSARAAWSPARSEGERMEACNGGGVPSVVECACGAVGVGSADPFVGDGVMAGAKGRRGEVASPIPTRCRGRRGVPYPRGLGRGEAGFDTRLVVGRRRQRCRGGFLSGGPRNRVLRPRGLWLRRRRAG